MPINQQSTNQTAQAEAPVTWANSVVTDVGALIAEINLLSARRDLEAAREGLTEGFYLAADSSGHTAMTDPRVQGVSVGPAGTIQTIAMPGNDSFGAGFGWAGNTAFKAPWNGIFLFQYGVNIIPSGTGDVLISARLVLRNAGAANDTAAHIAYKLDKGSVLEFLTGAVALRLNLNDTVKLTVGAELVTIAAWGATTDNVGVVNYKTWHRATCLKAL